MTRSEAARPSARRRLAVVMLIGLFLLRHDLWWWDDPTLVFGLPIGLTSQVLVCLLAIPALAYAARAFGVHEDEV